MKTMFVDYVTRPLLTVGVMVMVLLAVAGSVITVPIVFVLGPLVGWRNVSRYARFWADSLDALSAWADCRCKISVAP